jgi:glycosyltransferase involved in cell wall biosynthesis
VACKLLGFRSFVYVRESEDMVTDNRLGFLRIYLLRFMTGVICVSHSTAKWVSKYVAVDKIKILHNGIKLEAASLGYPSRWARGEKPVIGIIGRLDYRKGIDRFYALVDFCNKHQTFYQYKIIGDIMDERFHLSNYRGELRDETQITMTGLIKDVIAEITECSVILMLSRQEALPRVVLEAGSVGVPVLALDVAGTREMLPENYRWVLPEDTKIASLAVQLAELLKEDSNGSVGHGNKKFIEQNFDREVLVGDLIKFISI